MSILDRAKQLWSRVGTNVASAASRPPLEKYYVLGLCALISYMVADLGVLYYRPNMIPAEAPPVRPAKGNRVRPQSLAEYSAITDRDIFNEDGKIPDPLSATKNGDDNVDRPAVLSQLPIQLLGTIVHFNPKMSIATVSISSKNMSSSYKVGEEIENMARVTKIERKKVTFVNLNNRRNEYIEIAEDAALNFGMQAAAAPAGNDLVEQRGKFDFAIKRSDFEGLTQNLSSILQQARMEPVFSPDGISVEGFKFSAIQPGSPFEKMGFKVGDMITNVNGEPVNSPTKAMEMYNLLKTSNNVQLGVSRDGHDEKFNYTIQ